MQRTQRNRINQLELKLTYNKFANVVCNLSLILLVILPMWIDWYVLLEYDPTLRCKLCRLNRWLWSSLSFRNLDWYLSALPSA